MTKLSFTVPNFQAAIGDQIFAGGEHVDVDVTDETAPLFAAAVAAGAIEADHAAARKLVKQHVQTQKAGEAANAKAVNDGSWRVGNLQAFVLGREDRLAYEDAVLAGDVETPEGFEPLSSVSRKLLEHQLAEARDQLAEIEAG